MHLPLITINLLPKVHTRRAYHKPSLKKHCAAVGPNNLGRMEDKKYVILPQMEAAGRWYSRSGKVSSYPLVFQLPTKIKNPSLKVSCPVIIHKIYFKSWMDWEVSRIFPKTANENFMCRKMELCIVYKLANYIIIIMVMLVKMLLYISV